MGYEYDVFLSFTRSAGAGSWVREHLHRSLVDFLSNAMPRDARVFVDWETETGTDWPHQLAHALQASRLMVSVLSPPYFRSPWCMAEWGTMMQREQMLNLGTVEDARRLIHPVIFADGDHFPDEAHRLQHVDLSEWAYDLPYGTYSQSPAYLGFLHEVRRFASVLARRLENVPEWQPHWPLMEEPPLPEAHADIPRLWERSP